jgi:ubiquinone/menaquinone biosynthesis C-methylase UbiE
LTEQKQVEKQHYFDNYDNKKRWISYYNQIKEVLRVEPDSVLEIGKGNGTVSTYLSEIRGIEITTLDIDPELNPDVIGSVEDIPFSEDSFDTLLCAEVLEHLPFQVFEECLEEMRRVAQSSVVLTLPHAGFNISFSAKLIPFVERKGINVKIPITRLMEHEFDGEHYWEVGKKGYSLDKIRKIISIFFEIERTYCDYRDPYHRLFSLRVED